MKNFEIKVYLDDGRIFTYKVNTANQVREHTSAIINGGYRHNDGKVFEHYPPHRIMKVKVNAKIDTKYTDTTTGT